MDQPTSRTIKGYQLLDLIGEGAYGAVYRARQQAVDREVAVKIILPEFANRPDFIRRFEAEAQLVAQLEHLHIVPLYDFWRDPQGAYLVMRLMKGGSLEESLASKEPWNPEEAATLVDQVASALEAAHQQGVVHGGAVRDGDAFVIVGWDNDEEYPTFTFEQAFDGNEGVMVHYSRDTRKPMFASKRWKDDENRDRLNLYLPDRVERGMLVGSTLKYWGARSPSSNSLSARATCCPVGRWTLMT